VDQHPRREQKPRPLLQSLLRRSRRHRNSLPTQFLRRTALLRAFTGSYGKILTGAAGAVGGSYLGFLGLLKAQEGGEISRVVAKNECGSTPLWRKEDQVVNLRERDYKTFMSRREGR
jgi:hypothetical protein